MDEMTPERIKELRELCAKATKGEWRSVRSDYQPPGYPRGIIVHVEGGRLPNIVIAPNIDSAEDAEFMIQVHQNLPDLLDALEAAQARIAGLELKFCHIHRAQYRNGVLIDACGACGLDLRDPVHQRSKS